MSKNTRVVIRSVVVIIVLFLLLYSLTDGMGRKRAVEAKFYVNGVRVETPAMIYWRGESALAALPLFATIESLGGQIERDEQSDVSDAAIRVGDQTYDLKAYISKYIITCDLYQNGQLLLSDIARPARVVKGPLYMAIDIEQVLTTLGFTQATVEIDENEKIVRLTAVTK